MPRGFEHGDGWFDILWRLCEDLEPLVAEFEVAGGPKFEVLQVKEKFGGLRFYVSHRYAAIDMEIDKARLFSLRTCEQCGNPGTLRSKGGWLVVSCDNCLNEGKSGA